MTITKKIKQFGLFSVLVLAALFIAIEINSNLSIKAVRQDILFAIQHLNEAHSKNIIVDESYYLQDINPRALHTKVIQAAEVHFEDGALGGRLIMSVPVLWPYSCPDLAKEFSRYYETKCQDGSLFIYDVGH